MFKIIAETAFSHEGDYSYLIQQIDIASEGKADFIKFQIFIDKDEYIVPNHPAYSVLDKWMFTKEQWIDAFNYARKRGLKILALPLNVSSLQLCLDCSENIGLYEIHSVCFNDIHLIDLLKSTEKKIVLGIGGRTEQEAESLINKLQKKSSEIILMYGFQSFPTEKSKLNLRKIENFRRKFNVTMGYADHSSFENDDFLELNTIAYTLGSEYFEKHIVLSKGEKRIDFESAISSEDFLLIRQQLEELETTLGVGNTMLLNDKEQAYKRREKQMVYSEELKKGDRLKNEDINYKITESVSSYTGVITGKTLKMNVQKNETVQKTHFS